MATIGEKIKEARKNKKMTQKQLAGAINRSTSVIQKYEAGTTEPPLSVVEKIALALDVSPSKLLNLERLQSNLEIINSPLLKLDAENKAALKEISLKISQVLDSLEINGYTYEIIEKSLNDTPLSINLSVDNKNITLDADDLIAIYEAAKSNFDNSVKNIINIMINDRG